MLIAVVVHFFFPSFTNSTFSYKNLVRPTKVTFVWVFFLLRSFVLDENVNRILLRRLFIFSSIFSSDFCLVVRLVGKLTFPSLCS